MKSLTLTVDQVDGRYTSAYLDECHICSRVTKRAFTVEADVIERARLCILPLERGSRCRPRYGALDEECACLTCEEENFQLSLTKCEIALIIAWSRFLASHPDSGYL